MARHAIIVQGGAGPDSDHIRKNQEGYEKGIKQAVETGYRVLEEGGSALDAVEAAVNYLEDDPLFNSGRGSALNEKAEVEMCASIMSGHNLQSGAVAIVKNIKNPVTLSRAVMEKTKHIYIGNMGALEFAEKIGLRLMPEAYFITDHAFQQYQEALKEASNTLDEAGQYQSKRKTHGTVGAVAIDKQGHLAAATSTGGTVNQVPGRIGDSSMIGVGCYANNRTCAVSTTGDGEVLMQHVLGFHLSALMEYGHMPLREAARYLVKQKLKEVKGDVGLVAIDALGNIAIEFNSERMHHGWKTSDGEQGISIYRE